MDRKSEQEAQKTLEKIKSFKNLAGAREYNTSTSEVFQLEIKVDNSVPHGQFIPSQIYPGQWRASEQTFKAMKKDLFALGDSIDEIKEPYQCDSCDSSLDRQFWHFCPFCGASFKEFK
ncbi:MAG: hypothetical protein CME65_07765 [Halobacteriovoraceae bacterium]|nr:hypothetical protein [Halobacteriovoraceae bacterium]|tara:strand:+ start:11321 stop:11674 length:354 start_codon:yes stop_codon:yes gene_type:complete